MDDFIGRADLMALLWERLRSSHLLLFGPRRVGKSRLLEEMRDHPTPGCALVRLDLQGASTAGQLARRLQEELAPVGLRAKQIAERVQSVEALGVGVELSAARTALAELRRLRGDRRLSHVRWVLTGSVGIPTRASRWQASAELNDLDIVEAPPLDKAAGVTLFEVECTGRGRGCDPAAGSLANQLAGGRPHWIRTLAERSCAALHGTSARVTEVVVESEVQRLLGTQYRHLFQEEGEGHFGREYTPQERAVAERILETLSSAGSPLPRAGVLTAALAAAPQGVEKGDISRVLLRLIEEFYVAEVGEGGERLAMAVPLFAAWWQRWGRA